MCCHYQDSVTLLRSIMCSFCPLPLYLSLHSHPSRKNTSKPKYFVDTFTLEKTFFLGHFLLDTRYFDTNVLGKQGDLGRFQLQYIAFLDPWFKMQRENQRVSTVALRLICIG